MTDAIAPVVRQVRFGLVLNGGVSLAIWMGGVTHELDAARSAHGGAVGDTSKLYHELLSTLLGQNIRIDVISGASAGGINGALLGAAIATGNRVPDLRGTWIELGDFATLLRRSTARDPPSLMQGNDILLKAVQQKLDKLEPQPGSREALYVYVAATSMRGRTNVYSDATGRTFTERDQRHTFSFELPETPGWPSAGAGRREGAPPWPAREAGPTRLDGDEATWKSRLADAMRASSSFPVAFEASGPFGPNRDWFVDAGIYDNQPFGPVLDRIGVLPAKDTPVKRVVAYVTPYVNELPAQPEPVNAELPTALDTASAAFNLPNALTQLQGLDRVTADHNAQEADEAQRAVITRLMAAAPDSWLAQPAAKLCDAYRETRWRASAELFRRWSTRGFVPGSGRAGQDPTIAVRDIIPADSREPRPQRVEVPWIPAADTWSANHLVWDWGLDPAERVATWALLLLREALTTQTPSTKLAEARACASELVWEVRALKQQLSENIAWPADEAFPPIKRALRAYHDLKSPAGTHGLTWLQGRFRTLDTLIVAAQASPRLPRVSELLEFEVVSHALRIDADAAPFPFRFIFMSAGTPNSLGHVAKTPDKLSGMKLGHFGGFLKRSWRANDWLWGRLDGVEHVLRATIDVDHLEKLWSDPARQPNLPRLLASFAFGSGADPPTPVAVLERVWMDRMRELGVEPAPGGPIEQFEAALRVVADATPPAPHSDAAILREAVGGDAGRLLEVCRAQFAARIQLHVLRDELPKLRLAAKEDLERGTSATTTGALWLRRFPNDEDAVIDDDELVELFCGMHIGEETVADELLSRPGLDVAAQTLAVTSSMLAGARSGLPGNLPLAAVRAGALALSFGVRLFTRHPAQGAAAIALLSALTIVAFELPDTLLGSVAPVLAILSLLLLSVVLVTVTGALTSARGTKQRTVTSAVMTVVLAAIALLAFGVRDGPVRGWLIEQARTWPTNIVAVLAAVAAGCALGAGVLTWRSSEGSLRWARGLVNALRVSVLVGALVAGAGIVYERFQSRCESRKPAVEGMECAVAEGRGIVFVCALLVTLSFAVWVVEHAPRRCRSLPPVD